MAEAVNIGEFDTRAEVFDVVRGIGSDGQKTVTPVLHSVVFARVERVVAESVGDGNVEALNTLRVTMYKIPALTTRWRIRIAGQMYEITDKDDLTRISRLMTLTLSAING